MKTFKSSLKALGAAVLFGSVSLVASAPASAQSLTDVLAKVRQDANQMSSEDQARLRQFQADKNSQAASMQEARNVLAAAEGRARTLSAEFDANEAALSALEAQVSEQAGDFQELLGQFRSAAGATMPEIANSFANFDYTDRVAGIAEIADVMEPRIVDDAQHVGRGLHNHGAIFQVDPHEGVDHCRVAGQQEAL